MLGEVHVEELLGMALRDPERPEDITPEQARLLGYLEQAMVLEEFWKIDPGIGQQLCSVSFGAEELILYGTEEQKKKYLYIFSLASAAILLIVIALISIHYQKRAMLNNISKNKLSHSKQSVPTKETATTDEIQTAALQKKLTDSALKLKEITSPLSPTANTKKKYSSPSSNNSPKNVAPILLSHKNISQGSPEGPDATTQTEVEKLNTPASFSDTHIEYEKNTSQKDDQKSTNSISSKGKNHPHPSTDSDRFSSKIESKAAPPPLQNTTKQQETSSLFSGTPYKKAVVVKATEKKERKTKRAVTATKQASKVTAVKSALRKFVKDYTASYIKKDIRNFSRFFANGALENGVPFSKMREQYKQLFKASESITYKINLLGTDTQNKGASATLTGRFHVKLKLRSGKHKSNTGTLTFFLVKKGREYKIKALNYTLDP